MASPEMSPLRLDVQPDLIQAAAASPDGNAFRIVHHPTPEAEVSGWVWAEPPNSSTRGRVGLWALGCGHCGTTHCAHVDATLQQLDQVLQAAPTPETWQIAGAGTTAQLTDRARRAAEEHHRHQTETEAEARRRFDEAFARIGTLPVDTPIPYIDENATAGLADQVTSLPFYVRLQVELDVSDYQARAIGGVLDGASVRELQQSLESDLAAAASSQWRARPYPVGNRWFCTVDFGPLQDRPHSWAELGALCDALASRGASVDPTDHLRIEIRQDPDYDIAEFNRLFRAVRHYDDLLERLATSPGHPAPRRGHLPRSDSSFEGFGGLGEARDDIPNWMPLSLRGIDRFPTLTTDRPAATLDHGRIQAHLNVLFGLLAAARRPSESGTPTAVGTHHRGGGDDKPHDYARQFARHLFSTIEQVGQFAALYATTDWQPSPFSARDMPL